MKTELFNNVNVDEPHLHKMIDTALEFFQQLVPSRVEALEDGTFDIVGETSGLELGSYGIRERKSFTWIYGTGVALPRLTYVQAVERELNRI